MLATIIQTVPELIDELELNLAALTPAVVLISSLILSPEASARVKALVPTIIAGIVTVASFLLTETPLGTTQGVTDALAGFVMLTALAVSLYKPLSSVVSVLTGGSGLNDVTGPGLVGRGHTDVYDV